MNFRLVETLHSCHCDDRLESFWSFQARAASPRFSAFGSSVDVGPFRTLRTLSIGRSNTKADTLFLIEERYPRRSSNARGYLRQSISAAKAVQDVPRVCPATDSGLFFKSIALTATALVDSAQLISFLGHHRHTGPILIYAAFQCLGCLHQMVPGDFVL